MDKFLVSATKIGFVLLFLIVNAFSALGQGIRTEQQVQEFYERRIAEIKACKGDLVCARKVKEKHRQQSAKNMREFMSRGSGNKPIVSKSIGKGSDAIKQERPKPPTRQEPISEVAGSKTDEFDLGDLDF